MELPPPSATLCSSSRISKNAEISRIRILRRTKATSVRKSFLGEDLILEIGLGDCFIFTVIYYTITV